jgi:hypothetical protein
MIIYQQCDLARNERTLQALREISGVWPLSPASRVESAAAAIVSAMTEIHGGEWQAQIDHQRKAVLVWAL